MEVGRFVKTTGVCPVCRTYVKLDMSKREFTCPSCNSMFDRDVASAIVILKEGLSLWNVGETPGDENALIKHGNEGFVSCLVCAPYN